MWEFNTAYHHLLVIKRKKRLIVLSMLENLAELDANDGLDTEMLRQYLRQYTFIDYRADDWLDKLLYALPLRGLRQHNEDPNDNVLLQPNEDRNDDVLVQVHGVPNEDLLLQRNEDLNDDVNDEDRIDDDVPLLENV